MSIKAAFGPAGNSDSFYAAGKKHTFEAPGWIADFGLDAYEYQAGNGVRGSADSFRKIGEQARLHGIKMSLHAPYYISLSGVEPEKRLKSIDYISQAVEAAHHLGADTVVIHTGSAAKISRAEAMELARDTLFKVLESVGHPEIRLGLETMGKVNQLGTLEEVLDLCTEDVRLCPVVDFGHLNARTAGGYFLSTDDYRRVFNEVGERLGDFKAKDLHCHFSMIEYTAAGEKKHLTFKNGGGFGPPFEPLCEAIVLEKAAPRIICESDGTMAEDALTMKRRYLSLLK